MVVLFTNAAWIHEDVISVYLDAIRLYWDVVKLYRVHVRVHRVGHRASCSSAPKSGPHVNCRALGVILNFNIRIITHPWEMFCYPWMERIFLVLPSVAHGRHGDPPEES